MCVGHEQAAQTASASGLTALPWVGAACTNASVCSPPVLLLFLLQNTPKLMAMFQDWVNEFGLVANSDKVRAWD